MKTAIKFKGNWAIVLQKQQSLRGLLAHVSQSFESLEDRLLILGRESGWAVSLRGHCGAKCDLEVGSEIVREQVFQNLAIHVWENGHPHQGQDRRCQVHDVGRVEAITRSHARPPQHQHSVHPMPSCAIEGRLQPSVGWKLEQAKGVIAQVARHAK
jgi:hypothetical protein